MKYFIGIDPGETGGIGMVDASGRYVACARWDSKDPASMVRRLEMVRQDVALVYLEQIQAHPGEGMGHVVSTMPLYVNWGIWQGFLLAVGLAWVTVHPWTWQKIMGLERWASKVRKGLPTSTPLETARSLYPGAPLQYQADDGKAVGLLLARIAWDDHRKGFDRHAANLAQVAQAKKLKSIKRKLTKARKAFLINPNPWEDHHHGIR